jgi:Type VI secretion system/phage-baseplate injector OB domain
MDIKRIAQSSEFAQSLETDQSKTQESPALPSTMDSQDVLERHGVDDEVLVAFQHGDFSQPFVVGGLWNSDQAPTESDVKNAVGHALSQVGSDDVTGSLFSFMMEYQKTMNKENREDKKLQKNDQELELQLKSDKLDREVEQIQQSMDEAMEKFDSAFGEASYEMLIGLAGSLMKADQSEQLKQMGAMLDQLRQAKEGILSEISQKQDSISVTTSFLTEWIRQHKPDD